MYQTKLYLVGLHCKLHFNINMG